MPALSTRNIIPLLSTTVAPVVFPTTTILDNFNRANEGPPPSSNWTGPMTAAGPNGLQVVSNQCQRGSPYGGAWWNASTFGPNSEVYLTARGSSDFYVYLRMTGALGTSSQTGYRANWTGNEIRIRRVDNGSGTVIGGPYSVTGPVTGNKFGLSAIGSTITAYVDTGSGWTAVGSVVDATYSTAGVIGVETDGTFDDFGGGTCTLDAYSQAVLAQNPDHFLPLQETSGTNADDATANNRDGTFGGTYTLGSSSLLAGVPSAKSVDFNDTGYIQVVGYIPYDVGINTTFMGWAVRDSSTDHDVLWAAAFGGAANNGPMLAANSGNNGVTFWNDVQDASRGWSNVLPANGTPFHWALTYNDTTRQPELFINGVKQTSDIPFDPGFRYEPGQGSLYWGAWGSGTSRFWDGRMSHVAVWDSILSDATILSLYTIGAGENIYLSKYGLLDSTHTQFTVV